MTGVGRADLPRWVYDLLIAVLKHEDEHAEGGSCFADVLCNVGLRHHDPEGQGKAMSGSREPSDWEVLAVALMRRLGDKVELSQDELREARATLDPTENQTLILSYSQSQLAPWPPPLTVELRTRPRAASIEPDAIPNWIRRWIPDESSIFGDLND